MLIFLLLAGLFSLSFAGEYLCSICIDDGAKIVEEKWHDPYHIRLLYNYTWGQCDDIGRRNTYLSDIGCFRAKFYDGIVPHGHYYLMHATMDSLRTGVNQRDLRRSSIEGFQKERLPDGTYVEFEYCLQKECFIDWPKDYSGEKPIPEGHTKKATTYTPPITTPGPITTSSTQYQQEAGFWDRYLQIILIILTVVFSPTLAICLVLILYYCFLRPLKYQKQIYYVVPASQIVSLKPDPMVSSDYESMTSSTVSDIV